MTQINLVKSLDRLKVVLEKEEAKDISKIQQYESYIGKIVKIPINDIQLDENIRREIDTESIGFKSLLLSIQKHGIQQNIIVEFRNLGDTYNIVCVSGHRRVTAAKLAGTISVVPALIKKFASDDARTELALIENLLRENLHCIDIAMGYKDLFIKGWSRDKLSKSFGKTDRTIRTYLKMANWSEEAKNIIFDNPNIFNAKTLTRKIACRKFDTEKSLIKALTSLIKTEKIAKKKDSKKDVLAQNLQIYLKEKKYHTDIENAILATFSDLKLLDKKVLTDQHFLKEMA